MGTYLGRGHNARILAALGPNAMTWAKYFPILTLYKVVLAFEFVNETLKCQITQMN